MSRRGSGRGSAQRAGRGGALDSPAATGQIRPTGPVRTCVGCRERAARDDLLRVVAVEGRLVPDRARHLPGRGASVHPDVRCIDLADTRRAFPRALRLPGPLDATALREAVQQQDQHSPQDRTAPRHREQVEKPHERSMSQHR
jgi:hypothetical protein